MNDLKIKIKSEKSALKIDADGFIQVGDSVKIGLRKNKRNRGLNKITARQKKSETMLDRTESLLEQEAEKVEFSKLSEKENNKPSFGEIFRELTVINLLEFFLSPVFYLIKKIKFYFREEELLIEDPFKKPRKTPKGLTSFIILSLLFIFPICALIYYQNLIVIKDEINDQSIRAIDALKVGQESAFSLDLYTAIASFGQARSNFYKVLYKFNELDFVAKALININPDRRKATEASLALIEAGESLAEVGKILAMNGNEIINTSFPLSESWQDTITIKLSKINEALSLALPKVANAQVKLEAVDVSSAPIEFQEKLAIAKELIPAVESGMTSIIEINDALLTVLGHYQWQRYLLIFENSNEMRATGGFIGSYALVDIDRGKIKNIEIPGGGSYDLQGSLLAMVASPEPFHLINPIWEFQDSNWWPDFPTSAQKISWFYYKAGGPTVDGIIAITSQVMERLLEILGPISMEEEYGRTIDSNNFVTETQKIVELEYDKKENRPKQFIADLAPKILEKIFNSSPEELQRVADVIMNCISEKQLMFYSNNKDIQNILSQLNWAGEFKAEPGNDYLAVINTNLAGGKTDGTITQTINHQVEFKADGKTIDTLTINKVHNGDREDIFSGAQNNSYIRVYVPLGSKLISASGFEKPAESFFEEVPKGYSLDEDLLAIEGNHVIHPISGMEIYNEQGKTVFGNWLSIKPGHSQTVTLEYELPFRITPENNIYKLKVQKQAGTNADRFFSRVINNGSMTIASVNPREGFSMTADNGGILQFVDNLVTDKYFEVKFE